MKWSMKLVPVCLTDNKRSITETLTVEARYGLPPELRIVFPKSVSNLQRRRNDLNFGASEIHATI